MTKAQKLLQVAEKTIQIEWTNSGKPVFDKFDNSKHKNFSRDDHVDAMSIHSYLFKKQGRQESKSEGEKHQKMTLKNGKSLHQFGSEAALLNGKRLIHKDFM